MQPYGTARGARRSPASARCVGHGGFFMMRVCRSEPGSQSARTGGSGRKKGSGTHVKICISMKMMMWDAAVELWQKHQSQRRLSWLVDGLLAGYVKSGGSILKSEAAI